MNTPKPRHCGQNWLEMQPVEGGRMCGQCEKKITDFSKMSWSAIEAIQQQNNNTVCGMYHPKQLEHWGKEIPKADPLLRKAAVMAGLSLTLSATAQGQTKNFSDSLVIRGRVTDETTNEVLPFAVVQLKNNKKGTHTDVDGNFEIVLRNLPLYNLPDTLEVNEMGYEKKQFIINDFNDITKSAKDGLLQFALEPMDIDIVSFYVTRPTWGERMKAKFRRMFKRKEDK